MYNGAGVQGTVAVLGLAGNQGIGSVYRAPPEHWPREKSRRGQRSILVGGFHWRCGYRVCGGCKGAASLGRAKTSPWGRRKTVPRGFLGCSCCDGGDVTGLKTRPTWWQLDRLGERQLAWPLCLGQVVCCGIVDCQASTYMRQGGWTG